MSDILMVVDHASNHVPADIDLGIAPDLMDTHIAWDIGAAPLAEALGFPTHLATVSRLVIDLNREADAPGLVPLTSDGHPIPGNPGNVADRVARFYRPYHASLAARIARERPALLVSLHSFTPQLGNVAEPRPWEIGVLYNNDDRAARIALPLLAQDGVIVGDQQPYSGKVLNATMNRHGEATGTPYLGLEVRHDLIAGEAGVAAWAPRLRPVIVACAAAMALSSQALLSPCRR
ncbi:MAG: N-formylglutamate amidohydrolase [Sphingomonadaceae bacterium]